MIIVSDSKITWRACPAFWLSFPLPGLPVTMVARLIIFFNSCRFDKFLTSCQQLMFDSLLWLPIILWSDVDYIKVIIKGLVKHERSLYNQISISLPVKSLFCCRSKKNDERRQKAVNRRISNARCLMVTLSSCKVQSGLTLKGTGTHFSVGTSSHSFSLWWPPELSSRLTILHSTSLIVLHSCLKAVDTVFSQLKFLSW